MSLAIPLLLGAAALAWTAMPLWRGEEEPAPLPPDDGARDRLADRKEVLYESIRDLDFEHATGKLTEADYRAARAEMMADAAGLLRELDATSRDAALDRWIEAEIATRRAARPAGAGAPCSACQHLNPAAARFCDACGIRLAGLACPGCGAGLREGARFCNGCGRKAS